MARSRLEKLKRRSEEIVLRSAATSTCGHGPFALIGAIVWYEEEDEQGNFWLVGVCASKGPRHHYALHHHAERNALRLAREYIESARAARRTARPLLAVTSLVPCKWCGSCVDRAPLLHCI